MQLSDEKINKIKFSLFMINFAHLISMIIIYTAIDPFRIDYKSAHAFETGLYIAFLVPLGMFLLLGSLWAFDRRRKILIQVLSLAFLLIMNTIMIFDLATYTEWIGAPPVVFFGLYWLYSYYTPTIYFLAVILVTMAGIMDIEQLKKKIVGENLKFGILIIFGVIWGEMWIFLNKGVYFLFWIQNLFVIFYFLIMVGIVFVRIGQNSKTTLDSDEKSVSNSNSDLNSDSISQDNSKENLKNGGKTFFKFLGLGLPIILSLFLSTMIWHLIIVSPSIIPLMIKNMPVLIIGSLIWIGTYQITKKRFVILIGALITLAIALILLNLDPYAINLYDEQILWLSGLSISGLMFSIFMHLPEMNNGKFSRNFWSISLFTLGLFGIAYGFFLSMDHYPLDLYPIALPIIIGIIGYYIIIKTLVIRKKKKSNPNIEAEKIEDHTQEIDNTESNLNKTESDESKPEKIENSEKPCPDISNKDRNKKGKFLNLSRQELKTGVISLMLILIVALPIPIWSFAVGVENNKEQVLGSPNGDYYLWYADSLRTIDKNYEPSFNSSTITNTVKTSLARGEYEGFQVIFSPGKIKNLNVWSFEPKGNLVNKKTGSEIGSGNITVQMMSYVEQLGEQYPDRLAPFKRLDTSLTSGQKNWPFFITVFVPNDNSIEAGTYNVQMEFKCRDFHDRPGDRWYNYRNVDFNIEVEVYNFSISKERHIGMEIIWNIEDSEKWVDFYGDYRMDAYYPRVPIINSSTTPGNLYLNINWTKWESDLANCFENGISYFPITFNPKGITWGDNPSYTPEYQTVLEWYIGNVSNHFASYKTPWNTSYLDHAYFFVIDEPPIKWYAQIISVAKIIHAINPNIIMMETMNRPLDTYPAEFLHHVDIYCQYIHHWEPSKTYPSSEPIEADGWPESLSNYTKSYSGTRDKELWVYLTHNRHPTPDTEVFQPGILHRNSLWLMWTYKVDGWLYWSFNWGMDMYDGYGYAGYGESTLVGFDYNDDPMSSLRLERVRDGVEDFEYFWLLNKTCEILHSKGMLTDEAKGKALLAKVDQIFNQPQHLEGIPGYDTTTGFEGKTDAYLWSYEYESQQYFALRNEIGDELNRIYSLGII
jgi:glycosyl hydrolase family 123